MGEGQFRTDKKYIGAEDRNPGKVKVWDKVKNALFPSHDPEEDQASAWNQVARKEAGVEMPKEPAKVNQAEEGMKSARENLEKSGKSPTVEGKGKENFERNEKELETKLPRHETQEGKMNPSSEWGFGEKEKIEEATPEQETEIETEVTSAPPSVGNAFETKDPKDAKEALVEYAISKGIASVDKNGNIKYKTTAKSVGSQIGNVLSALLTIATGGAIPPVNFYKMTGAEGEDKARQEAFAKMMNNIADYTGRAVGAGEFDKNLSNETARSVGEKEVAVSGGEREKDLEIRNTIKAMMQSNANAKDYGKFMSDLSVSEVPRMVKAMDESGIPLKHIIESINATRGLWSPSWAQQLEFGLKNAKTVGDVVNTWKDVFSKKLPSAKEQGKTVINVGGDQSRSLAEIAAYSNGRWSFR